MIDYPEARTIAYDYLTRAFPGEFSEIAITEERTREKNYGWMIFFYNPKWAGRLRFGGLGPLIVMKEDGMLYDLGEISVGMLKGMDARVKAFEARRVDPRLWLEEDRETNLGIQLALAADEEDLATVQRLCKQGVSADSLDPIGRSALTNAAQRQCIPIVRFLLNHGADVNLPWPNGITPLAVSLWNEEKSYSLVKMLLKAGASVHLKSDDGRTVLHSAVSSRIPVSVLRLLIRAGADVNAINEEGISPLMLAAQQSIKYAGQMRVRYLLWKGADVSLTDFYGQTALDHALEHEGPVKLLTRSGAIRGQRNIEKEGYMLYNVINQGNTVLLNELLGRGIDINACYHGATALMWAVRNGQPYYVKMLLEAGADVNRKGEKGWTPLHFAVHNADQESLEVLLEANADVHVTDDKGISPLALAIERDDPAIIARLKSAE